MYIKTLTALALATTLLTGCASFQIENQDLPKCSGGERRPLNGDLWDWQSEDAKNTGVTRVGAVGNWPILAPVQPKALHSFDTGSRTVQTNNEQPRWKIAASEQPCGDNHG